MYKKISAITIADALTKGVGYLLLPLYLGLMPQQEFGEFSFIFSSIAPFSLVITLSLYIPFIRTFCEDKSNNSSRSELVSTVFNSLFIWLIIIDFILLLVKPFFINTYINYFNITYFADEKYYLVLMLVNTGAILLYCYSLLMSRKNTYEIIIFMLVRFIFVSGSSLAFVYFDFLGHESVLNRLFGIFVAEFFVAFSYVFVYVRPYVSLKINFSILKDQLIIAWPLVPSGLIGLFLVIIDRGLIAEHHGLKELASYNLSMMALVPLQMLMSATQVAWAPHIFSLNSAQEAMKQTIRIIKIAFFIMIVGAVFLSLLIYLALLYSFIGSEYSVVPEIILYSSIGVIASVLTHFNSNMFVHLKKTGYQLGIGLLILAINWSINIALIADYSFIGAAIAAGLANVIGLIVGIVILNKLVNRSTQKVVA